MPKLNVEKLIQTLQYPDHALQDSFRESPQGRQWLQEQLASPELQDGLWALAHSVFPESFCPVCVDTLPHYVHLEALGQDAVAAHPRIKAHLDRCPRCRAAYTELLELVSAAYADEIPAAPAYPTFDLPPYSFTSASDEVPGLLWRQLWENSQAASVRIHRLVTEVALSLAAPFERLADPLRPALVSVPAPAYRGLEQREEVTETIQVLNLKYPPANLLIRIGRGPVVAQRTALVIDVLQADPPKPIPATRVALLDERHRLMEQIGTDPAGSVCFEDVNTGRYFVQVRHADDMWEFPLLVSDPIDV